MGHISQLHHTIRQQTHGPTPVSPRWLATSQGDQMLFHLPFDGHFVRPPQGPLWAEGRLKTLFHELLSYAVDGGETDAQRLGNGFVGIPHAFRTCIRLQQNAAMEQFARGSLARRNHFPYDTSFLICEGDKKFGHGGSPSPQTTMHCEKEKRSGSTCQSKIAKLLGGCRPQHGVARVLP